MRVSEWLPKTNVWIILILATLMSLTLAESALTGRVATTAVILIAAFKVRLVLIHFMELESNVQPWRALLELWIGLVSIIILTGYWLTPA